MTKEYRPIDQWEEEEHPKLSEDIEAHISVFVESEEDAYHLKRFIFTSIRQHEEEKAEKSGCSGCEQPWSECICPPR